MSTGEALAGAGSTPLCKAGFVLLANGLALLKQNDGCENKYGRGDCRDGVSPIRRRCSADNELD